MENTTNPRSVVLYARGRTPETVIRQTAACMRLARREGWHVEEAYEDIASSSTSRDREQWAAFLKAACRTRAVLVYSHDRLSRDHTELGFLQAAGIQVIAASTYGEQL